MTSHIIKKENGDQTNIMTQFSCISFRYVPIIKRVKVVHRDHTNETANRETDQNILRRKMICEEK